MSPIQKALWYMESHFAGEITLDDIAVNAGVSRYYITRAFGAVMGISIIRYLRGRRLTEAARALANGAPDILAVALDAGYGSHEAFTRAFRDQFGTTPEAVRTQGHLNTIILMEPLKMDETQLDTLESPRFENGKTLLIAGLSERYTMQSSAGIPAQWQRFTPYLGHFTGQIGKAAYGVVTNADDTGNMDYLSGVEVGDFSDVPAAFTRLRIAPQRYVVFHHAGHVSAIRRTWATVWSTWMPQSGHEPLDAPFFERHGPEFHGETGLGGFELWLPIKT